MSYGSDKVFGVLLLALVLRVSLGKGSALRSEGCTFGDGVLGPAGLLGFLFIHAVISIFSSLISSSTFPFTLMDDHG